jgi:hypothetical protein
MPDAVDLDINEVFSLEVLSAYPRLRIYLEEDPPFNALMWNTGDIVRWMALKAPRREEPPREVLPSHLGYWDAFKVEFKIFLCTKNRKYQTLRREVASHGKASQTVAVGLISGAIGAKLGTVAGVVTPLVIISLIIVLKLGKEAYCRTVDVDLLAPFSGDPKPRASAFQDISHLNRDKNQDD